MRIGPSGLGLTGSAADLESAERWFRNQAASAEDRIGMAKDALAGIADDEKNWQGRIDRGMSLRAYGHRLDRPAHDLHDRRDQVRIPPRWRPRWPK